MIDDLDDLLEDNPSQKPNATVATKMNINKFGGGNKTTSALKDDFDDLNDDNDGWGPQTNARSASNAKPPTKI